MTNIEALGEWKKLYKPPFKYHLGYIFDSTGNMVADNIGEDCAVRIRGWGLISSTHGDNEIAEMIQDSFGEALAELLNQWYDGKE